MNDKVTEVNPKPRPSKKVNVPVELAMLEIRIKEGLPYEEALKWSKKFAIAVKNKKSLSRVPNQFKNWLTDFIEPLAATRGKKIIRELKKLNAQKGNNRSTRHLIKSLEDTVAAFELAANSAYFIAKSLALAARSAGDQAEAKAAIAKALASIAEHTADDSERDALKAKSDVFIIMSNKLLELVEQKR